jgi:hypothetical protein
VQENVTEVEASSAALEHAVAAREDAARSTKDKRESQGCIARR